MTTTVSRREFLRSTATAGGGLLIAIHLPRAMHEHLGDAFESSADFVPNAWITITPDNVVTVSIDGAEMGQGVHTSLAMLIAEELDADWSTIKAVLATGTPELEKQRGGRLGTGGSRTIISSYQPMRRAAASARAMLVQAAATKWGVDPSACTTSKSVVTHAASKRSVKYGDLAADAASVPVPTNVTLKNVADFTIIGKPTPRLDTAGKVDGSAVFGIDVVLPNMLVATLLRPPAFGAQVASVDDTKARAVPGVREVLQTPNGVAVVADGFWQAQQGQAALVVKWSGIDESVTSASISAKLMAGADSPAAMLTERGSFVVPAGGKQIDATYELPFLAHAPMEPMNCTAHVHDGVCEVWAPTQSVSATWTTAATVSGLPRTSVTVHPTFLGGGFGRRSQTDFVTDAVAISKVMQRPIKVIFTREDDVQHDFYRPAAVHKVSGAIDASGALVSWRHHVASTARASGDRDATSGLTNLDYAPANLYVGHTGIQTPVPTGFWRSVGNSMTAFAKESFIDELAAAAGKDPYEYRRSLLGAAPRIQNVLDVAAKTAGWGTPLPAGRARGIACQTAFGSFCAQVAEVSVTNGKINVHKVVCAIDCGVAVNPSTIEAQAQSAIAYGLTAALYGHITIDKCGVLEANFDDYAPLRMSEMPEVITKVVPSTENPGGIGETGTPPIAPAVANAVFALTGKRLRKLPLSLA